MLRLHIQALIEKEKENIEIKPLLLEWCYWKEGIPRWLSGESTCSAGDVGLIPGLGRSAGRGNGKPLQYFCLGNPMDRGAWWAAVHSVAKSDMVEPLSIHTHTHTLFFFPHTHIERKNDSGQEWRKSMKIEKDPAVGQMAKIFLAEKAEVLLFREELQPECPVSWQSL